MKRIVLLTLLTLFVGIAKAQVPVNLYQTTNNRNMEHWVDSVYRTLSPDERIGQLFMLVADPGKSYHERILKNINEQHIGGLLFSGGKLADQVASINLYQKNSRIPLLISFDGEWGLAMRLKEDTPLFPHNMMIGAIDDLDLIRLYGEEVGRQCRELGVHINFAPALDVNINPANPVIGNRSFGENPDEVARRGIAYARGLESQGVISVGKHFPGHGDTDTDSHEALPRINHSRARLDSVELPPFVRYINSGLAGMMTGHMAIPALDSVSGLPTSLSPKIVQELLVDELGFTGLTFTDALVMKGASAGKRSICVSALLAGNDILLSPGNPIQEYNAVKKAVSEGIISRELINEKCRKVLSYKYIVGLNNYRPIPEAGLRERINSHYSSYLIQQLNEAAITLLKNKKDQIPLKFNENKVAVVSLGEKKNNPFQETLALYTGIDCFSIPEGETGTEVLKKLRGYETVVCGIHSAKATDSSALQNLCKATNVHLCFFVSPYRLSRFRTSIEAATSVSLAYENTAPAQKAAAGVIMGGVPARGRLSVSISDLFKQGSGIQTEKVRLTYGFPEEVKMSPTVLDQIDNIAREGIREQAYPGCQILVARKGVVVYHKSFGAFDYSGQRPVENNDLYDLASVTKAVATVPAVMKLYDQQKIKLPDRLSRYVPLLKESDKAHITVKSALFHETGLGSFLPFYTCLIDPDSYQGPLYSARKTEVYNIQYDDKTYMRKDFCFLSDKLSREEKEGFCKPMAKNMFVRDDISREVIGQIVDSKVRRNNNYLYSDLNFILLKEMVERVAREPFDLFLDQAFYAPLGASSTTFLPLEKFDKQQIAPTENDRFLRDQVLQGYVHDEAAAVQGGISGNAGLFSTANDLAKVLQMLLNGGVYGGERYLSEATVQEFIRTKSPFSRRGLGFDKPDMDHPGKGSSSSSAPASSFGHAGYTGTCFWVDPDNELIFIFLSNRVYPSRTHTNLMKLNIRPRIHDVVYAAFQ
ncbi:serine hydrolase [Bacteroidales bacterium OttesenSCG-928-L03]|nr:serine hydrolase [Bacteroidales bacterium OttesenSCG-928-L03]